ncbi:MAG: DUF2180 family protein [Kiritimatiellia bacterium]
MICFECFQRGQRSEAVGVCHHCSVAVCAEITAPWRPGRYICNCRSSRS